MIQAFTRSGFLILALVATYGVSVQSAAQDIEGSGDHPEIPRVAGSSIVYFNETEYDRVSIPTGPYDGDVIESEETMEGEVLSLTYTFDNPDISTLQIKRNYRQALEERGFEILFAASEDELSGDGGRFFMAHGTDLFKRGARQCCHLANRDRKMRYLAARSEDGSVLAGIVMFNARRVDGPAVSATIVTSDEMDTAMEHEPLTAGEMESGLVEDGRVAVQDILFEHDSAAIHTESADALATIAELLKAQDGLQLLVVGHTDNSGQYDYNLNLSMERATAVVTHLVNQHDVDGSRLDAAGAGMMAPVTTNRTEEGRSLNRRVELVEMGR
ncbi:MAG: OmpA family protein [Pseudomonadota bacterium]